MQIKRSVDSRLLREALRFGSSRWRNSPENYSEICGM